MNGDVLEESEKVDQQRKMKQREADTRECVGAHEEGETKSSCCLPASFAGPGSGPLRTGCLPCLWGSLSIFLE